MIKKLKAICNKISNNHVNDNYIPVYYANSIKFSKNSKIINSFLSDYEINKATRFYKKEDALCYSVTHAMLRFLLSGTLNLNPRKILIESTDNNKPEILNTEIDFNISHSANYGCVAIADNKNLKIGIDLERIKELKDINVIINDYMSKAEQEYILNSDNILSNKKVRFYEIWTRKESLLKMTGIGLVDNLNEISLIEGENLIEMVLPENINFQCDQAFIYTYNTNDFIISISFNQPRQVNLIEFKNFL